VHISFKVLGASALVIAGMVAGLQVPAGAQPATGTSLVAVAAGPAAVPNSNITASGRVLSFVPNKLSAHWSGPPPTQTCTAAKEGLTISNKTTKTETVTYRGATFATIAAGKSVGVCGWGTGHLTAKFGLKGSTTASLTISFS
jgi:hypothetical protein